MASYESKVKIELRLWEKDMLVETGILENLSRKLQKKIDAVIPEKIHLSITKAVEIAVNSVLKGINIISVDEGKISAARKMNLQEIDREVDKIIDRYKKLGVVSGAGTGAGGLVATTLDYPALVTVKLKMLQEIAQAFGYNIKNQRERIFLLKVFLLAFSGNGSRRKVFSDIKNWDILSQSAYEASESYEKLMDWREFYSEYRESIEFKKMFQFVPGIGAIVGAWANYDLVQELGVTSRNSYRIRYFNKLNSKL